MRVEENRNGINWGQLILGILFVIVAFIAFRDPEASLRSIAMFLGIIAIVSGIGEITLRNRLNRYFGDSSNLRLISGVVQIILGIVIILNLEGTIIALPYLFAFWFIFSSIMGLILSRPIKLISTGVHTTLMVLNILGIIVGFMMLSNPLSAYVTIVMLVGFYFLVIGIRNIIQAF